MKTKESFAQGLMKLRRLSSAVKPRLALYYLLVLPAPPARKAAAQTAGQKVNCDRKVQYPIAPAASSMRRAFSFEA